MRDLASRLANRVQLTTDGHRIYLSAVRNAFGAILITRCWSSCTGQRCGSGNALQPRRVHRLPKGADHWTAEVTVHFYQPCRTAKPDNANEDAPSYPPNECLSKKAGESPAGNSASPCTTTLVGGIKPCASRQQWKQVSPTTFGASNNSWDCSRRIQVNRLRVISTTRCSLLPAVP